MRPDYEISSLTELPAESRGWGLEASRDSS